jgi:hypothetical protein
MKINVEQVGTILEDIFICGWNDKSLNNEYRHYHNALVQLIYNYGRISNHYLEGTKELIFCAQKEHKLQIENFIEVHFSNIDTSEIFN